MANKEKVFCKNCTGYDKDFWSLNRGYLCKNSKHESISWYEKYNGYNTCAELNSKNNCKLFKEKPIKRWWFNHGQ